MSTHVEWYDQAARIIVITIKDEFELADFEQCYRQMFDMARKVNDKVGLLCDLRHMQSLIHNEVHLPVIGSPFVGLAVFVSEDDDHPVIAILSDLLRMNAPDALFSNKRTIPAAVEEIQRLMPHVITNI